MKRAKAVEVVDEIVGGSFRRNTSRPSSAASKKPSKRRLRGYQVIDIKVEVVGRLVP